MTGDYSWPHVRKAERVTFEKFHSENGLTIGDHLKIRDMCRAVNRNKKRFLYYRMIRYIPEPQLACYFDGWTPKAVRNTHGPDGGTPISFATATVMV